MLLRDFVDRIERQRRTVVEYSPSDSSDLEARLSLRNVDVTHRRLPDTGTGGFVVVRRDDEFRGTVPLETIERARSLPEGPTNAVDDAAFQEYLDLFDKTVFASYDRRQMLATAREIEDRAWRVGRGTLYVGFQSLPALRDQVSLYESLGERDDLAVRVYISDEWDAPDIDGVTVQTESADEIGDFWFLVFEGGGDDANKSALIAEERTPDEYYGFWTYDPELVDEITAYLRETY